MANAGEIVAWGDTFQISATPPGKDFARIAPGGARQSLAIRNDGTLALWKLPTPNGVEGTDLPSGANFIDAVLSVTYGLAVQNDGVIRPFGYYPTMTTPRVPVAVPGGVIANVLLDGNCIATGGGNVVILKDGPLYQWDQHFDNMPVPPGKFKKVVGRNDYAVALSEDGDLSGWGAGFDRLWDALSGTTDLRGWEKRHLEHLPLYLGGPKSLTYYVLQTLRSNPHVPEPKADPFVDLAAGNIAPIIWYVDRHVSPHRVENPEWQAPSVPHVLALHKSGAVSSWGKNTYGEAQGAPKGFVFRAISAGHNFSMGLDQDGHIYYWGEPGAIANYPDGEYKSIGAAAHHAAAVVKTTT